MSDTSSYAADDRIRTGSDFQAEIDDDEKLQQEEADGELTQDEIDRLDSHD